jgi:RNA polymerase sigma factor (sigma-70 family)
MDDRTASAVTDAVAELYRGELTRMTGLATMILGSRSVAEDVVQEAFAGMLPRIDAIEEPKAYLRTTVVNGCRKAMRRPSREVPLTEDHAAAFGAAPSDLGVGMHDLAAALSMLNPKQRTVLGLRYVLDWSDRDIAEILEIRRSTVRSTARRALRVLRSTLGETYATGSAR